MKKERATKYERWNIHANNVRLSIEQWAEFGKIVKELPKTRTTSQGYFVKVIKKGDQADYHFTLNHKWRIITIRKVVI